jgi:VIT1/CCC1 family predicted Fe2+/Mn2+ transporter
MDEMVKYFKTLSEIEWYHYNIYKRFAALEKDVQMRNKLLKFSEIELRASKFWNDRVMEHDGMLAEHSNHWFLTQWNLFLRRAFGSGFALNALEYSEEQVGKNLKKLLAMSKEKEERQKIMTFMAQSEGIEEDIEKEIIKHSNILSNIRDIVFGINDGLVEVLAATVGFAAALQSQPTLVFFAGSIVAISGTLSMAGGAYIATEYEAHLGKRGKSGTGLKSAFYVGLSYIVGALFPILPFALGFKGFEGIALSVVITAVVLSFTAALIAVVSKKSISKRILANLAVSLGAASVTIILGLYARYVLKIYI